MPSAGGGLGHTALLVAELGGSFGLVSEGGAAQCFGGRDRFVPCLAVVAAQDVRGLQKCSADGGVTRSFPRLLPCSPAEQPGSQPWLSLAPAEAACGVKEWAPCVEFFA